jgi:hypothetical protein
MRENEEREDKSQIMRIREFREYVHFNFIALLSINIH